MDTEEALVTPDTERYRISGPFEVAAVLRGAIDHRIRLRAQSRHTAFNTTTCIVEVNPRAGWMMFDRAPDAELAACIFASQELQFDSRIDNVLMAFVTHGAVHAEFQGMPAWRTPLPEYVTRIQRREYHRTRAPVTRLLSCRLTARTEDLQATHECSVADISPGGFAAHLTARDFPVIPELRYECSLDLKDLGVINTQAQLCTCSAPRHAWGVATRRAGFKFTGISGPQQTLIQRYLLQLQRRRGLRGL